jgi:2,4-dienoyl-CoA reductase-like NADH-dependent reductase (Old Yellow Enzyme family)/nucleotide-binding universal stress UspA family protein
MDPRKTKVHNHFDALFRPFRIGSHQLPNRLVALPVFTGYAFPDGSVSPFLLDHYRTLAASGVGMVVVANTAVEAAGVTSRHNLRIDRDEYIPGLSQLAEAIRQEGALACLQLNHAGRFAKTEQPFLPSPIDGKNLAFNIAALKDFMEFFPLEKRFRLTGHFLKLANSWHEAMTDMDRERIIKAFGEASERAYQAGFDMIELHGANGYLLCQFLSAFTHPANSDPGADFQRRTRFPIMVIKEIQNHLPPNFPIGFRLILREWVPKGIDLEEAIAFARLLQKAGIAYISSSVGTFNSIFLPDVLLTTARPGYLKNDMIALKRAVDVPTIISGRITTPYKANQIIRENVADLVGLGRPLRVDPDWVHKAGAQGAKVRVCINCNDCLKRVILEEGFNCRQWPKLRRQRTELSHKLLLRSDNMLCIVTGRSDLTEIISELRRLLPVKRDLCSKSRLTILFLVSESDNTPAADRDNHLIRHTREVLNREVFSEIELSQVVLKAQSFYDAKVKKDINTDNYGIILTNRLEKNAWQTQLLYRERGKVLGLLSANKHTNNILVPVDLSETTLLILTFLKRTYFRTSDVNLHFVHVSTDSTQALHHRWKALKQICDLNSNSPSLAQVPTRGDIAATIMETANANNFGTIVMGKRGLSGIKRWLLGSVSAGVLRRLSNQSLFLID